MAFKIYEKLNNDKFRLTDSAFSLAGKSNFIRYIWGNIGEPKDGWVVQNAQINFFLKKKYESKNDYLIIVPTMHYDVIIDEIWGWTYTNEITGEVNWTPLLFVYKKFSFINSSEESMSEFNIEIEKSSHEYEFMYLKGDWNWPRGPHTSPLLKNPSYNWLQKGIGS